MLPFSDFIKTSSFNSVVEKSKTAQTIYEKVIWRDDVRISFVDMSIANLPALAVCANEIERICAEATSDLDLNNPTVKQTIGRMISVSIEPFGYVSRKGRKARMPLNLNTKHFKYAHVYNYDGGETQKIEKRIITIVH